MRVYALPWLVILLAVLGLGGCALTEGHVDIAYTPVNPSPAKVIGAEETAVQVTIDDQRPSKDTVGHKSNGYGMEMAQIKSDNDVDQTLQSAIEGELKERGFTIASGGAALLVTLTKFENTFKNGFWSGTAEAEIVMNTVVKNSSGNIIYTKLVDADGINDGIQLASPENAQIALDAALQNGVAKLFEDNAFISALQSTGKGIAQVRANPANTAGSPQKTIPPGVTQTAAVPPIN